MLNARPWPGMTLRNTLIVWKATGERERIKAKSIYRYLRSRTVRRSSEADEDGRPIPFLVVAFTNTSTY